jgi:hypothetical protein
MDLITIIERVLQVALWFIAGASILIAQVVHEMDQEENEDEQP